MSQYLSDTLDNQGIVLGPEDGDRLEVGGNTIIFKVTSDDTLDQLGVYEIRLAPRTVGAQLHYHRFMDETFIVQQGVLTVQVGPDVHELEPGAVAFAPRFTPHGFRNDSDSPVKLSLIFNPGQKREGFFYGLRDILTVDPVDASQFLALYNKYDSFPVDPENVVPGAMES